MEYRDAEKDKKKCWLSRNPTYAEMQDSVSAGALPSQPNKALSVCQKDFSR